MNTNKLDHVINYQNLIAKAAMTTIYVFIEQVTINGTYHDSPANDGVWATQADLLVCECELGNTFSISCHIAKVTCMPTIHSYLSIVLYAFWYMNFSINVFECYTQMGDTTSQLK